MNYERWSHSAVRPYVVFHMHRKLNCVVFSLRSASKCVIYQYDGQNKIKTPLKRGINYIVNWVQNWHWKLLSFLYIVKNNDKTEKRWMKKTLPCVSRIRKSSNTKAEQKNNINMFLTQVTFAKTGRWCHIPARSFARCASIAWITDRAATSVFNFNTYFIQIS